MCKKRDANAHKEYGVVHTDQENEKRRDVNQFAPYTAKQNIDDDDDDDEDDEKSQPKKDAAVSQISNV